MAPVTVLLTGDRGLLGERVAGRLKDSGQALVTYAGDLADEAALRDFLAHVPELTQIVHLAGRFFGTWGELEHSNVATTQTLLEVGHALGVRRITYASSGAVYGEPGAFPSRESDELLPTTLYGLTKMHAESSIAFYARNRGWRATVLRFPSLFGPSASKGVVHDMLHAARTQGRVVIHGDGTQSRQLLHVDDAASAVLLGMGSTTGGAFNIASPIELTINKLADAVCSAVGNHVVTEQVPATNEQKALRMDGSRARTELGHTCVHTSLDLAAFA